MKTLLVCLHGWGGSHASFTELRAALQAVPNLRILTPDLPGFGDEPEPPHPWTVDDYANWVVDYVKEQTTRGEEERLFLLGHSHGGRIAITLAHRQATGQGKTLAPPIAHLFLCAAAGIRRPRHLKRIIGLLLAKGGRALCTLPGLRAAAPWGRRMLYRLVRVHDYERASPLMQQTLLRVSQQDLRPLLPSITVHTDLFWGDEDSMTPIADGLIMAATIPHAALHRFPGIRHKVHRDRADAIAATIQKRVHHP